MTVGNTAEILTRQAARWGVAAQQDNDPTIALLHASYGVAYVLALEHIGQGGIVKAHVLAVAEQVEERFPQPPAMYPLGRKVVDKLCVSQIGPLVPWLLDMARCVWALNGVASNAEQALAIVVIRNLGMGFVMALRQVQSDTETLVDYGVDPLVLEGRLGTAQVKAMKQAARFLPRRFFPKGPLVQIAGHG